MPEYRNPQNEPGMDRNLLFVFLLMAIVIFGSQLLFRKNQSPQPTTTHPNQQQVQPGPLNPATPEPSQRPVAVSGKKAAAVPQQPTKQASSESQIVIENELY